jgi:hypothetical protein
VAVSFATAVQAHDKSVKEQLGSVKFPVSCSAEAQKKFNRAMALLHSFDWGRGKAAFEEVAQADPKCGMAHWGLAMIAAGQPVCVAGVDEGEGRSRGDRQGEGSRRRDAA